MEAIDILIDPDTCDIIISDGDLKFGLSDQQHVEHILRSDKGHFRQWPLLGVGIEKLTNGSVDTQQIKQDIRAQLKFDNYNVRQIIVTNDFKISIDAKRIV